MRKVWLVAVNYHHKDLYLSYCRSPRYVSGVLIKELTALVITLPPTDTNDHCLHCFLQMEYIHGFQAQKNSLWSI